MKSVNFTDDIVSALSKEKAYPHKVDYVKVLQTHISYIFLTGKYAYKLKKPVNFGFLDFTTLDKRKEFCEKEVHLNKRLAKNTYLGVLEIRRKDGEIKVGGDEGEILDYVVWMRELDQNLIMENLLKEGKVGKEDIEKIAKTVSDFHKQAKRSQYIDKFGDIFLIRKNWDENFYQTVPYIGKTIKKDDFLFIKESIYQFLTRKRDLLEKRVKDGKIRDCHGDLYTAHIWLGDSIEIFDCIEFNERFRYSDVCSEVAFLVMDLEFKGYETLGKLFLEKYVDFSKDYEILELFDFYACYRAYVRGKVESFLTDDKSLSSSQRDIIENMAKARFKLSLKYAKAIKRPTVFAICGLVGTGKTTISKKLGNILGEEPISSDLIRKEMLNIPLDEHRFEDFEKGIYSKKYTNMVYKRMHELVKERALAGKSTIVDASYHDPKNREELYKMCKELDINLLFVICRADEDVIKERLFKRMKEKSPSDGRWEIYLSQKMTQKVDSVPSYMKFEIDTYRNKEITKNILNKANLFTLL